MYVCTWKRRVLKEHVSLALIKGMYLISTLVREINAQI